MLSARRHVGNIRRETEKCETPFVCLNTRYGQPIVESLFRVLVVIHLRAMIIFFNRHQLLLIIIGSKM